MQIIILDFWFLRLVSCDFVCDSIDVLKIKNLVVHCLTFADFMVSRVKKYYIRRVHSSGIVDREIKNISFQSWRRCGVQDKFVFVSIILRVIFVGLVFVRVFCVFEKYKSQCLTVFVKCFVINNQVWNGVSSKSKTKFSSVISDIKNEKCVKWFAICGVSLLREFVIIFFFCLKLVFFFFTLIR